MSEVKGNKEQSLPHDANLCGPERWREWKRMLDLGEYRTQADLARGEGVSRAAVTKGLQRLALSQEPNPDS